MKKFLVLFSLVFLTSCGFSQTMEDRFDNKPTPAPVQPPITNQTNMQITPEKGDTVAKMTTNFGEINILLYTEKAPETAKNFIEHSKAGRYDNNLFHRVMNDFMIQGGDFENRNGTGGYSYKGKGTTLQDEFGEGLEHIRGAVSMANAGPNTGGSQFFIVQKKDGTSWLDGKHAIFGYVYEGMDIVDEIAGVTTGAANRPLDEVIIEKIEISEYK